MSGAVAAERIYVASIAENKNLYKRKRKLD
jgi:hypothetical protein